MTHGKRASDYPEPVGETPAWIENADIEEEQLSRIDTFRNYAGQWRFNLYGKGLGGVTVALEVMSDDEALALYEDLGRALESVGISAEPPKDPAPLCRCECCPVGGPFTCVSED